MGCSKNMDNQDFSKNDNSFLDKDLDAALDSFDNLFCRRCLVSILYVFSLACCFVLSPLYLNLFHFHFGRCLIADCMDVRRILSFL